MFNVNCGICKKYITEETETPKNGGSIITVATMINSRQFWYGISGVFSFAEDYGLKDGDEVCNECLRKHKFSASLTVKCDRCGSLHQPVYEKDLRRHGWKCSADVSERDGALQLQAEWGSGYDCSTFRINGDRLRSGQQICDDCIQSAVESGELAAV